MGSRGRKSRAELTVVPKGDQVMVVRRPEPPRSLSDEAAAEWREVVNSVPADHFGRAVHSILEAYCRHAVATRQIDQLIQDLDADEASIAAYDKLLAMHERESRALASLAVRLGIACAANLYKTATIGGKEPTKPWEKLAR